MLRFKNFSRLNTPPPPYDTETEFELCNFMQPAPDTSGPNPVGVRLWPGDDTPRTFIRCNLMNCEPPPSSTVIGGLNCLKTSGINGTTQEIKVGGVVVHTHQNKFNRVHGRRNSDGTYTYRQQDTDEA